MPLHPLSFVGSVPIVSHHRCDLAPPSSNSVFVKVGGHLRRSAGVAFQVGVGNCGGIIATFSFLAGDAPKYVRGYSICLGFLGLAAVSCTLYFFALVSENANRARSLSEHSGKSEEKARLGDLNPDYRYML